MDFFFCVCGRRVCTLKVIRTAVHLVTKEMPYLATEEGCKLLVDGSGTSDFD